MLSLSALHAAYYKMFIKNNNSLITREEVAMSNENSDEGKVSWWKRIFERIIPCIMKTIRKYRDKKINPIICNEENAEEVKKEQLVEELRSVRCCYNAYDKFSSGFVLGFLSGFIGLLAGFVKPEANLKNIIFMAILFIVILLCQEFFVYKANIYYEKMEVVKAELEKINNSAQSNPEKISIRIYNRNLVRHSNFIS